MTRRVRGVRSRAAGAKSRFLEPGNRKSRWSLTASGPAHQTESFEGLPETEGVRGNRQGAGSARVIAEGAIRSWKVRATSGPRRRREVSLREHGRGRARRRGSARARSPRGRRGRDGRSPPRPGRGRATLGFLLHLRAEDLEAAPLVAPRVIALKTPLCVVTLGTAADGAGRAAPEGRRRGRGRRKRGRRSGRSRRARPSRGRRASWRRRTRISAAPARSRRSSARPSHRVMTTHSCGVRVIGPASRSRGDEARNGVGGGDLLREDLPLVAPARRLDQEVRVRAGDRLLVRSRRPARTGTCRSFQRASA